MDRASRGERGQDGPYVFTGEDGAQAFAEAGVQLPRLDAETGRWLSEIILVNEEDAALAAPATTMTVEADQAASGQSGTWPRPP